MQHQLIFDPFGGKYPRCTEKSPFAGILRRKNTGYNAYPPGTLYDDYKCVSPRCTFIMLAPPPRILTQSAKNEREEIS